MCRVDRMTHIPNTPQTILATVVKTVAALSAISALVVLWLAWSVAPAHAAAEPPPTTDHETCVPVGDQVTDIDTGNTYTYSAGPIGFDSCGQPIPDVCVDWGDHHSTLWTLTDCTPEAAAPPATATPVVTAPTLPATGGEGWLAVVAAGFLFAGLTLVRVVKS